MQKTRLGIKVALVYVVGAIHLAHGSTLVNIENLAPEAYGGYVGIPHGYRGLQWHNFAVLNGLLQPTNSGYRHGVISTNNVSFNVAGNPASFSSVSFFDFNSAHVTAQLGSAMQLQVQGLRGTTVIYDNVYVLNSTAPILMIII
jgi:hypothetical protein